MSAVDDLLALGLPLPEVAALKAYGDWADIPGEVADLAVERLALMVLGHKDRIRHEVKKRERAWAVLINTAEWMAHEGWYAADGAYTTDPTVVLADLTARAQEAEDLAPKDEHNEEDA